MSRLSRQIPKTFLHDAYTKSIVNLLVKVQKPLTEKMHRNRWKFTDFIEFHGRCPMQWNVVTLKSSVCLLTKDDVQ